MNIALPIVTGLLGAFVVAFLSRRNARNDHADKLLAEALNDLVAALAADANGDLEARQRYSAAMSQIVLHGSPELVAAFRAYRSDPNRELLIAAVQAARRELGRPPVDTADAAMLLFGAGRTV
jgi:hypothetical protein